MHRVRATPDFVPHEAWDQFAWLLPYGEQQEPWYYAALISDHPRLRMVPSNPGFMKTVDEPLRPIVAWLHQQGVSTGPSCAGHDLKSKELRLVYSGLEQDAETVRGNGLYLYNPETGRNYLMQNDRYHLPWGSFSDFRRQAEDHQPVGWLPFYTTDPRARLAIGQAPGFEIKRTGSDSYAVRTMGTDPEAWTHVAAILRNALG